MNIPSAEGDGNGNGLRQASKNLNTILLWVTLAVLGFIGLQSYNTSIKLAELQGTMVGRQEIEAKIAEVKVAQAALDKDLTALKLALAERGIAPKK